MSFPEQWGSEFKIGYLNNWNHSLKVTTTVLRDGWIVESWWDTASATVKGRIFNADGSALGPVFDISGPGEVTQGKPAIAALPNGHFIVAYEVKGAANNDLVQKTFDVFSGEIDRNLIDDVPGGTIGRFSPTLNVFPDSSFIITYRDQGIQYFRYADGNVQRGDINSTSGIVSTGKSAVSNQGTLAILTYDGAHYTLYMEVMSSAGVMISRQVVDNNATADVAASADVAADSSGSFHVTYVAIGAPQTVRSRVFSATGFLQESPDVYTAGEPLGETSIHSFGVGMAYAVTNQQGGNLHVGAFVGGSWNTLDIVADAIQPVVTTLNDGRFMIQWAGPYDQALMTARIYDPRKTAINWTGDDIGQQYAGTKFGDQLHGAGGNDTLFGGAGDDHLSGDADDDRLVGGDGDDWLYGGDGADTLDGGSGYDMASYIFASADLGGIVLDLSDNSRNAGAAQGDILIGIEKAQGTNAADVMTASELGSELHGEGGEDRLAGKSGADKLYGGDGDDWLYGGSGEDILDGGAGFDMVSYIFTPADQGGIVLDLSDNSRNAGAAQGDILTGIEKAQGTNAADVMTASETGSELHGEGGEDRLAGKSGADKLYGGDGDDWLYGGGGADLLDGGAGFDMVSYIFTPADQGGIVLDLSDNSRNAGAAQGDVLSSIEKVQGTNAADVITGSATGSELHGEGGDDRLTGQGGVDTLHGGTGNDTLDGGTGPDVMFGGAGDDTYVIDEAGDSVSEETDGGIDTAIVSLNFSLTALANIEILKLADGTTATEAHGGAGNDRLIGNGNFNILDGSAGADTMEGGSGSDVFVVDDAGDVVIEAEGGGTDAVQTWIDYTLSDDAEIEYLTALGPNAIDLAGNRYANFLSGNAASNVLVGNGGDDTLDGGAGADRLEGGSGDDVYIVDNAGDTVIEAAGAGHDTVRSSVSFVLSADAEIEVLMATGADAIDLTGSRFANTLIGNGAANVLDGGAGADRMEGGTGNDVYVVDNTADVVIEAAGGGDDTVRTSVSYTLSTEVEFMSALGNGAITLTGNALSNTLTGNTGANVLHGMGGNDHVFGGAGADRVYGDAGNDTLGGGAGKDKLTGGKGRFSHDLFVFDTKPTSPKAAKANADRITDFGPKYDALGFDDAAFTNRTIAKYVKKKGGATLDHALKIDKHWFRAGDKALDRNDFFIYNAKTHKLYFDADGSGHKAMVEIASFSSFERHTGPLTFKDLFLV